MEEEIGMKTNLKLKIYQTQLAFAKQLQSYRLILSLTIPQK